MIVSDRQERSIYTVSGLAREVKLLLESAFPLLWVEGEISNLARPRSGHIYFSVKDDAAQIRCAMFRGRNANLRFRPQDGDQVLMRVRVALYEPRGDFQLIVEQMEQAGDGALRRAFDALKARLERAGLFAGEHKRELPAMCRRIGVVTSPTGAALRDVLHVLRRRYPAMEVLVYPVPVQGREAAAEIAETLRLADQRREVDALLLTRGGGSLEDLWPFNEEVVAHALFDCELPVVSAVGHETDFTIADFVADQRAPTPSAGAELLSPDGPALLRNVLEREARLAARIRDRLRGLRERGDALAARLRAQHPGRRLQDRAQRLDELESRLARATRLATERNATRLRHLEARLRQSDPRRTIARLEERNRTLYERLRESISRSMGERRQRFGGLARSLEAVSPLATLSRGYAVVTDDADGSVLRHASEAVAGERIRARLADGELRCRVEEQLSEDQATVLRRVTRER